MTAKGESETWPVTVYRCEKTPELGKFGLLTTTAAVPLYNNTRQTKEPAHTVCLGLL